MESQQTIVHRYESVKVNKCDIQYQIAHPLQTTSPLTERVKVEAFQGYSNAHNLGEYFRLRGLTNWKDGKQLTGLFRTEIPYIFYGDQKSIKGKSLILFKFENNRERLTVYCYPLGYYPNQIVLHELIQLLG